MRPALAASAGGAPPEVDALDARADRSGSVFIRRMAFAVIAIGLSATAMWSTDSPDVSAVMPFFLALITVLLLPMFWPAQPDAFSPVAIPALLLVPELVGEALRSIRSGTVELAFLSGLSPSYRVELVQQVLALWILSSLAHMAGFYLGTGHKSVARMFPEVAGVTWNKRRMAIVSGMCIAAFLAAYTFFQSRVSASLTDVTALAAGKAVWRDDPTMSWLGRGVLLGCIPLLFLVAWVAERPTVKRTVLTALACLLMALAATRLGQRGYGFMFGLSCLIIIHNVRKRFKLSVLFALAFGALVAFNVMGEWRTAKDDASTVRLPVAARVLAPEQMLSSYASDRNRIAVLATVLYYIPSRQDYFLGESYIALLAAPIPKWVWPEKQDYFKWRDVAIVGQLHGIPAPVPIHGVMYANFSWVGAAVGMFLWGLFQRGLYEWLLKDRHNKNRALLYGAMVLYLAPSSLALASTLQYVVPIYVAIKYAGERLNKKKATAPPVGAGQPVKGAA